MKEKEQKMGLYSIHSNPVCSNEFIVTGEDQFIRLYDKRKVSQGDPLKKFCPQNLVSGVVSKGGWEMYQSFMHRQNALASCFAMTYTLSEFASTIYLFTAPFVPSGSSLILVVSLQL